MSLCFKDDLTIPGEVYKANDTRLDRIVAIKVLPKHLSEHPEFRQRFEQEARAVSSLNHPHICTLYDVHLRQGYGGQVGGQDDIDYIVMEYLEGETLADRLAKGPLPLEEALEYAFQIADALDKAHRHGVVHRDLKPGNIMITSSGAKLLDFGLAKLQPRGREAPDLSAVTEPKPLTEKGAILGTFQYMAPEQLEAGDVDARTDIFAFGAMLYEMVTGRKAFEGKKSSELDRRHPERRSTAAIHAFSDVAAGARPSRQDLSCQRSFRALADGRRRWPSVEMDCRSGIGSGPRFFHSDRRSYRLEKSHGFRVRARPCRDRRRSPG